MALKISTLTILAGLILAASAQAAPVQRRITSIVTISGTCRKLVASKHDLTAICQPRVSNIEFNDGRISFSYAAGRDLTFTFSGDGKRQVHSDPDHVIQPIDTVSSSLMGQPSLPDKAVGICRFANPYKGSVAIVCNVNTHDGPVEADFVSDGSEPEQIPTRG